MESTQQRSLVGIKPGTLHTWSASKATKKPQLSLKFSLLREMTVQYKGDRKCGKREEAAKVGPKPVDIAFTWSAS